MGNYYWIQERRDIVSRALLVSRTWDEARVIAKSNGIHATMAALQNVSNRYEMKHPLMKRGGYRHGKRREI
jgi:hypothetical protein